MNDLEIIVKMLLENGIEAKSRAESIFTEVFVEKTKSYARVTIYKEGGPKYCMPDIGDPDFIKKVRDRLSICGKTTCYDCEYECDN